tara:strand:- start:821 stop:1468 length:648 start_codon:yes stop_codon:yes gene_type:complete
MNIIKPHKNFDAWYIDNFIPSNGLVRSAAESFDRLAPEWWVSYGDEGQIGKCSPASINTITHECLIIMDYIATHFDTTAINKKDKTFPDLTGYGGGMMVTPNKNNEGGFLGMHIDAQTHKLHTNWKREYSVVLGLSEDYDESFDLRLHNGEQHCRLPYKFNRLNIFKFHENSWHGFPEITKGKDRKTIGLMYWSITDEEMSFTKARFNKELNFNG